MHSYTNSQKYLATIKKVLFPILKVLFLMKQVKHILHIFWKIHLKVFFFFTTKHE